MATTVSSVSPAIGSAQGGNIITIAGTGFPVDKNSASFSQMTVTIGQANVPLANIISVSNWEIQLLLPVKANGDALDTFVKVQVTVNGQASSTADAASNFKFTTNGLPRLNSLSISSASPVLKTDIVITGTTFGTDKSKVRVFLDSATKREVYELGVVSVTDTTVNAVLGGGHVGQYFVRVAVDGLGSSIPEPSNSNAFSYIIKVISVSPVVGSTMGGTELTITGENFCAASILDNNVFISNGRENVMCNILTANKNTITCMTGPMDPAFKDGGELDVVVQGKLIEEGTCTGTCKFTYKSVDMPAYTEIFQMPSNKEFRTGSTYYVKGSLLDSGSGINILISGQTISGTVLNATTASFVFPSLPAGTYTSAVQVIGKGFIGVFDAIVYLTVSQVLIAPTSSTTLSASKAGVEIIVKGFGFDNSNNDLTVYLTSTSNKCLITSFTNTQINCRTPRFATATTYNVFVNQMGGASAVSCNPTTLCAL